MPDWLKLLLTNAALLALLGAVMQHYLSAKISQRLEPLTAEDVLRRQNFVNSKLAAFRQAADVVSRSLASQPWSGRDVPPERNASEERPSEAEINSSAAALALFSSDDRIRDAFIKCFQKASPADFGTLIGLFREDLGYGKTPWRAEEYPYIFGATQRDSA